MAQFLSEKDIYDLVSAKSYTSPKTVRRILANLKTLMVSEIKNNGKITINGLGTFKLAHRGGDNEWYINSLGFKEKKYVEEYDFVDFSPNKNFLNAINTGDTEFVNKTKTVKYQKNDEDVAEDDFIYQLQSETSSTIEVVHKLIGVKMDKIEEGHSNRIGNIKCLTNNTIYVSPNQACDTLKVSKRKMYERIKKGLKKFEFDGFQFEIIDAEEVRND